MAKYCGVSCIASCGYCRNFKNTNKNIENQGICMKKKIKVNTGIDSCEDDFECTNSDDYFVET